MFFCEGSHLGLLPQLVPDDLDRLVGIEGRHGCYDLVLLDGPPRETLGLGRDIEGEVCSVNRMSFEDLLASSGQGASLVCLHLIDPDVSRIRQVKQTGGGGHELAYLITDEACICRQRT